MTEMLNKKLLREYIVQILSEDDMGGIGLGDMGPGGSDFTHGDPKKLYNIFIKPFADVVSTAAGKGKEVSSRAQTLAATAFETIATTLIPVLSNDYDRIFANDKERIDKIKAQYKDVYDATWSTLRDNDVLAAAFAYAPTQMITLGFLRNAPVPVLNTLNVLAGGRFDDWVEKVKNALAAATSNSGDGPGVAESLIRESTTQQLEKIMSGAVPKLKKLADKNPNVQRMQNDAKQMHRASLNAVYKKASDVSRASSISDLQKITGKQINGNVPKGAEKGIIAGIAAATKKMYVTKLSKRIESATSAGVPEDHPYVADIRTTIDKIKAL